MSRSTKTNLKQSNNDNPFYDLRKMVFSLNVGTLGLEVVKSGISLCTVMEWEISGSVATLVSVIDGSTSLYLSTGGGIIGGGGHQNVVEASSAFREASEKYLSRMKKDSDFKLPENGHVCFYVVTTDGVYKYDGLEKDMVSQRDEFSQLFFLGQNTITELRKIV
ncbi:MAG TPA: hypothetical protein DCE02_06845 [Ruminiclostridium sp.]|jgi:hypothetical protein|uniref:Uncharacterized protein n=1 Tax=Acetivibrio saccincola TaxID=1677857 RepID=A0A2K9ELM8_9FIRM|nr:hypothetical protein [Acetivibrio saccincola]HAA43700.1 hypothetical protein [Ruminiclostridium sp.]HOA81993.1 hypothetical protein [Defluviitaleaceae bacterium]AUG57491.1 hypothetical protein HVS_07900 [Acetivibrio saccincola]NLW27260.1 hypothetical protein [Acetivibrio saccincola]PQQ67410.1 hypothetical protein B9R14_12070 [Acetivibrio saccincola]